jgi:hypothetical protein
MVDTHGIVIPKRASPKLPNDLPPKAPTGLIKVSLSGVRTVTKKIQTGNGHWQFEEPLGKGFGFIYLIHDLVNDKMYIGKKQYYGTGKQNKGVVSNWRNYTSSSKEVCKSIEVNGKENFEFYVLEQYGIRGTLGYAETWSLMYVRAPANRHRWYNMLVNKISWSVKEDISERHVSRLKLILEGKKDQLRKFDA